MARNDRSRRREARWYIAIAAVSALAGIASAVLSNLDRFQEVISGANTTAVVAGAGLVVTVSALVVDLVFWQGNRQSDQAAERSREAFEEVAEQVVSSVSLEKEASDVSASLAAAVTRLRQVSTKAEAFEVEVQDLVSRAEAAKATAGLHEDEARRIARVLGAEHHHQIDELRRSGNRMALWTFIGGVVLGIIGNIVVAVWLG